MRFNEWTTGADALLGLALSGGYVSGHSSDDASHTQLLAVCRSRER